MRLFVKESGYFLLVVLIFVHVFSGASFYELSQLKDQMAVLKKDWQRKTDQVSLEHFLMYLEKHFVKESKRCMIPEQTSDQLRHYSTAWWQQHGCISQRGVGIYWHVVERIMYDACAVPAEQPSAAPGIAYYRMSVRRAQSGLIMQSIVGVSEQHGVCSASRYVRQSGRQSWRLL